MNRIPQLVLEKKAKDGIDYKNVEIAEALGISGAMVSRTLRDEIDIAEMKLATAIAWAEWLKLNDVRDLAKLIED